MKVLQISKFFPPVMGGIESVAWELAEGLQRAQVQADVLCSNHLPHTQRETTPAGYHIVRAASFGLLLSTSMAPAMVAELARAAHAFDVFHVHMPDPMAAMALCLVRPPGKVVVHWHSDVIRQRLALRLYEPLQTWLLGRADAVVATSQAYADASPVLQPWRHKVAVVPIGISDNSGMVDQGQVARIRQRFRGRRIVFALGRMTYYKGFDVLIDAAQALPDHCAVLIGGDGELLDDCRHAVNRAGLAGKVHLLGHVPDDELASYYAACDIFCMPSTLRAEAYGVAIVEAMVMGKPVVATDIPGSGVPWVNRHGETGLNVPVRDAAALAGALNALLADETLRARYGEGARERYLQEFGAERMTRRTLELYDGLLGRPQRNMDLVT